MVKKGKMKMKIRKEDVMFAILLIFMYLMGIMYGMGIIRQEAVEKGYAEHKTIIGGWKWKEIDRND